MDLDQFPMIPFPGDVDLFGSKTEDNFSFIDPFKMKFTEIHQPDQKKETKVKENSSPNIEKGYMDNQKIQFHPKAKHTQVVNHEGFRQKQVNRIDQTFGICENINYQRTEELERVISSSRMTQKPQNLFKLLRIRPHHYKLTMAPYIHEIITERVESFLEFKSEQISGFDESSFFDKILNNEFKLVDNKPINCLGMEITRNHMQKTISFRTKDEQMLDTKIFEGFMQEFIAIMQRVESQIELYERAIRKGIYHLWYCVDSSEGELEPVSQDLQDILNKEPSGNQQNQKMDSFFYFEEEGDDDATKFKINLYDVTSIINAPVTCLVDPLGNEKFLYCPIAKKQKKYKKKEIKSWYTPKLLRTQIEIRHLRELVNNYPENWTDIENLSFKTSLYNTVDLELSGDEASKVIDMVKKTSSGIKVEFLRIERVQNVLAYDKYQQQKQYMQKKYSDTRNLEEYLFHGTKRNNPEVVMGSEEGFDMRFSNGGMWGRGVYFAKKFKYSHGYAYKIHTQGKTYYQVFLAKVLTGKKYDSKHNRHIKVPPIDQETGLRFDSVCGNTGGTKVHIVYENGQSYPEYCITYTITNLESTKDAPPHPSTSLRSRLASRTSRTPRHPFPNPYATPTSFNLSRVPLVKPVQIPKPIIQQPTLPQKSSLNFQVPDQSGLLTFDITKPTSIFEALRKKTRK
ncbi:unnamed protein product [Moneuplotes crassus]|uniref:Poly [ADP-ribose] polymerase n=1 Tax=Euplotes crassus TaxID=5936 RepID=A0AAD1XTR9_EUPCR|nr:unnamed protein product [Moneuplotes crassus]